MRTALCLLLLAAVAALPSARLAIHPQALMPEFLEMVHSAVFKKYVDVEKASFYYGNNAFDANKAKATFNLTNQTVDISYTQKNQYLYFYDKSSGSRKYKGHLRDFTIDSLLISYSYNGSFAFKVEDFKYSHMASTPDTNLKYLLLELSKGINKMLNKASNVSQAFFSKESKAYWSKYDMHLGMKSVLEMVNGSLPFLSMSPVLSHSYSSMAPSSPEQPSGGNFSSLEGSNLQVSEEVFNGFLQSAFHNGAFNLDMSSKAIQVWKKWLNLELADLDIGFVKAMLPEFDSDLEDNTLLDLSLSAQEKPVLALKEGSVHLTLRLLASLSYQKNLLGKVAIDGLISLPLHFNPASSSLDLSGLDVNFSSLTFLDGEDNELHTGSALALSALAQLAAPALVDMVNLKGLNLLQFVPEGILSLTPSQVALEQNNLVVTLQPAFSKNTQWKDIAKLFE